MESFVQDISRPKGLVAEGYIVLECLTFVSQYPHAIETKFTRKEATIVREVVSVDHGGLTIFQPVGTTSGGAIVHYLTNT